MRATRIASGSSAPERVDRKALVSERGMDAVDDERSRRAQITRANVSGEDRNRLELG